MEPQENTPRSLRNLTAALGQPRLAAPPPFQGFPPVDAEEIAQELDLYVRAAEAGQRGEPPSNAKPPDAIETAVGTAIESRSREAVLAYKTHLAHHDVAIRSTFLTDDECLEIEASCRSLLEELEARIRDAETRLAEFWRANVESAAAELQAFRDRNALVKPPKLVSRGERLIRGLVLAGLAIVGAAVSGRLLLASEPASDRMVQAILMTLLNIGPAAWYARRGLPPLVVRGFRSKLLGTLNAVAFLGWLLSFNVLAAHFRDVLIAGEGNAGLVDLWRHVSLEPFTLAPTSWLLAVLGIGSSIMALFVAAGMDELYPGYGAAGRRLAAAETAYRIEVSTCSEELAEIQRSAVEDLRAMSEAMQCRDNESNTAAEAQNQFHSEFLDHLEQLAATHDQLCRRYREINSAVQGGNVPMYFVLEVERPACLADPGLPHTPQARQTWIESIERLQQYAQTVVSLLAADRPPQVDVTAVPEEMEVEVPV